MKCIVSVSGGAGSTIAAHRAAERFGVDNVDLVFADTNAESDSLYSLLDCMDRLLKPVIRLNDGRDVWDVFDQYGIITTSNGACKASVELKHRQIVDWITSNAPDSDSCIIAFGLSWMEPERIGRIKKKWAPYKTWCPLTEVPLLSECEIIAELDRLGYPEQPLYAEGFNHNNCGGACVKAGQAQWAKVKELFPDRFAYSRDREKRFNEMHRDGKEPFTILRDQSLKAQAIMEETLFGSLPATEKVRKVTPITLEEFEGMIELDQYDGGDWASGCGCAIDDDVNMFNRP